MQKNLDKKRANARAYYHRHKERLNAARRGSPSARSALTEDKDYRLRRRLWSEHRITLEEFDTMVQKQDGKCLICDEPPPEGQRLCVDHCHDLNVIRGLLCHRCNIGLGKFKDNPALLLKAAAYVKAPLTQNRACP